MNVMYATTLDTSTHAYWLIRFVCPDASLPHVLATYRMVQWEGDMTKQGLISMTTSREGFRRAAPYQPSLLTIYSKEILSFGI